MCKYGCRDKNVLWGCLKMIKQWSKNYGDTGNSLMTEVDLDIGRQNHFVTLRSALGTHWNCQHDLFPGRTLVWEFSIHTFYYMPSVVHVGIQPKPGQGTLIRQRIGKTRLPQKSGNQGRQPHKEWKPQISKPFLYPVWNNMCHLEWCGPLERSRKH